MQLKYAFVIVPLFVAVPTFAQHLRFLPACFEMAKTQTAITECAGDEAKSVEAQMAGRYRELIDAAASVEGAVAKIAADQRAWVAHRDSFIGAMYPAENKQAEYGSIYPTIVSALWVELARQRIAALDKLLAQHSR